MITSLRLPRVSRSRGRLKMRHTIDTIASSRRREEREREREREREKKGEEESPFLFSAPTVCVCVCVSKHAEGNEGEDPSENGFHTSVSAFWENKRMIIVVVIDRLRTQSGESFSMVQCKLLLVVSFQFNFSLYIQTFVLTLYSSFFRPVFQLPDKRNQGGSRTY